MSKIEIEAGSGNVFADIGLPNAEEHLVKAHLVYKVMTIIKERELTQADAAAMMGVTQPEVSNMLRGRFERVSVEKLMHHLVSLGQDVEIVVRPHQCANRPPQLSVA